MPALSVLIGVCLWLFATLAQAHMQLTFPPPFNASNNPFRTTAPDPYLQYPYDCCGPNDRWIYPCRGYLSLLDTPQGAPTATWQAGSTVSWNISGIGNHYGGSCQVGFSVDRGDTLRVATSYEGNCPHRNAGDGPGGQNFDFTVPTDLEAGVQVFAWIWYSREQEFSMNCAAVNITVPATTIPSAYGSLPASTTPQSSTTSSTISSSTVEATYTTANNCTCICGIPTNISVCACSCEANKDTDSFSPLLARNVNHIHAYEQHTTPSSATASGGSTASSSSTFIPFNDRPLMLIADDGNGCLTPKTTAEVKYPNPGPDVVLGDGVYPLELPSGNCSVMPGDQAYTGRLGESD